MYDEVVAAAKGVLLAELGLPVDDLQRMVVKGLSYSRYPDYWQVVLELQVPAQDPQTYTVLFRYGHPQFNPCVMRGAA